MTREEAKNIIANLVERFKELVYELYQLTLEEIKIIEGGVNE